MIVFILTSGVGPDGLALGQGVLTLPPAGSRLGLSPTFTPPLLKGIKIYRNDPFRFDFILDKGDQGAVGAGFKPARNGSTFVAIHESPGGQPDVNADANKLIRYFLASLTIPEKDLWVNLSPYENDRIVPEAFGHTEMGRDLLAQDYILKQITASVIYPEDKVGQAFWDKVYAEAFKRYGTTDIPVDAFNKVWIVPEIATVYENNDAAFVTESRLKVMLETDYLAMSNNAPPARMPADSQADVGARFIAPGIMAITPGAINRTPTNVNTEAIVRDLIIPILEKEVNEGRNFAPLRQVYHSLILATWYKRKVTDSLMGQAYVDHRKTAGVDIIDKNEKEKIWAQYVEAFKKGACNLIKEEYDPATQMTVPRKYFSGGAQLGLGQIFKTRTGNAALPALSGDQAMIIEMRTKLASPSGEQERKGLNRRELGLAFAGLFTPRPAQGAEAGKSSKPVKGAVVVKPPKEYPLGEKQKARIAEIYRVYAEAFDLPVSLEEILRRTVLVESPQSKLEKRLHFFGQSLVVLSIAGISWRMYQYRSANSTKRRFLKQCVAAAAVAVAGTYFKELHYLNAPSGETRLPKITLSYNLYKNDNAGEDFCRVAAHEIAHVMLPGDRFLASGYAFLATRRVIGHKAFEMGKYLDIGQIDEVMLMYTARNIVETASDFQTDLARKMAAILEIVLTPEYLRDFDWPERDAIRKKTFDTVLKKIDRDEEAFSFPDIDTDDSGWIKVNFPAVEPYWPYFFGATMGELAFQEFNGDEIKALRLLHILGEKHSIMGIDHYRPGIANNEYGPSRVDPAMAVSATAAPSDADVLTKGGIDLNPAEKTVLVRHYGQAINFNLDPALLQRLQNASGVTPVIIATAPLNDLAQFMGIKK